MNKIMKKYAVTGLAVLFLFAGLVIVNSSFAAGPAPSANGHGTLFRVDPDGNTVRRQFSVSARTRRDGTVNGNAVLHNPAFNGANGNTYQLQVSISCMKVVGNIAIFGGTTRRTNDPNVVDAVYFSVQDNGEPGNGVDKISGVYFFDDDPNTTGDPALCQGNGPTDFPLETIEAGNIQVKP